MGRLVVIGMTGGVGAGKSTVLGYLKERYQAVILMADLVAKKMMEPGGETYQEILTTFGADLAGADGQINKALLAKRIFQQGYGTDQINALVHPAVVRYISERIQQARLEAAIDPTDRLHIFVVEAALLFEGHADTLCDEVWYVHADREERIKRLMESRGYTREKCLAIMDSQMDEETFREKCSVVLENNGEASVVQHQIDEELLRLKHSDKETARL
jgi:dephospho-CoA kinase